MTRAEKQQEKRAQEEELKRKKFEAQGFEFSTQEYHKKRTIANKKSSFETPEEELDRQATMSMEITGDVENDSMLWFVKKPEKKQVELLVKQP